MTTPIKMLAIGLAKGISGLRNQTGWGGFI
jgi:hypothetical protein